MCDGNCARGGKAIFCCKVISRNCIGMMKGNGESTANFPCIILSIYWNDYPAEGPSVGERRRNSDVTASEEIETKSSRLGQSTCLKFAPVVSLSGYQLKPLFHPFAIIIQKDDVAHEST